MTRMATRLWVRIGGGAAAAAFAAQPGAAQLITIGDVIDELLELDAEVTLQGQVLGAVQATVAVQAGALTQAQVDVAALQAADTAITAEVDALETVTAAITADVSALQSEVGVLQSTTATLSADVGALQVGALANLVTDAAQDSQIHGLQTGLAANVAVDLAQDGAIAQLGAQVDANDLLDAVQGTAIATLQGDVAANALIDAAQGTAIAGLQVGLAANDARDDAQDAQLALHDSRITLAQGTADDALLAVGVLRSDVDAGRAGVVRVDASGNLSVGGGLGGSVVSFAGTEGDRRLTGIAPGVAANDAATVGQLAASSTATLAAANLYTDNSLAALNGDMDRLVLSLAAQDKDLRAEMNSAAAGAAAIAGMPQAFVPGKGMMAVGIGGRGGEMAVAVGVGKAFNAPSMPVIRAGAAIDSKRGEVTYNAGVGFHF